MKNNALNASDQQKKQGLTRWHRDKNFHCSEMAEWNEKQRRNTGLEKSNLDPPLRLRKPERG